MNNYIQYINALRACAEEHKDDITPYAHIIVSKLCNDVADLLERLEQEPILDNIRAEIEELDKYFDHDYFSSNRDSMYKCNEVLQIIDKYKKESEE